MGLTNLNIYNRYSVREFTRKIEIKRRNTDGTTYESEWQDVEDLSGLRLLDKAVSAINYNVANNNYNFGIVTTGNVNIKLNSKNGQFDDDSNSGSIFRGFLRHKTLIRVTDGFVDNYTDPGNPVNVYNTVFQGFIDATSTGTKVDDENLIQNFQCIDLLSFLLKEYTIADMGTLTSTTIEDLIYEILNRTEFTNFFSVKTANINAGYNISSFDVSQYEAQTQLFTLFENFSIGHSFFYVRDEVFYYTGSITPNTTKKYPFQFTGMKIRPDNYSGLRYWNDSSDTTTIINNSSNEVERFKDKSGLTEGAKQYVSTKKPITNTSNQGGENILDFTPNDNMTLPSDLFDIPNGDNTIFVVVKQNVTNNNDRIINMEQSLASKYSLEFTATGGIKYHNSATGTGIETTIAETDFNIVAAYLSGTSQNISVNGSSFVSNNFGVTSATIDKASIGSNGSGTGQFLDGSIGEIIIFDRALTTSEINEILYYLSQKWKIEANIDYDLLQTSFDNYFKFQGMGIQPDNISELRYWNDLKDEASIIKNSSDEIERLIDKSGNTEGAKQYDPTKKGTYDATGFNSSYPTLDLDGTDDFYVIDGLSLGVFEIFIVAEESPYGGQAMLLEQSSNSNSFSGFYLTNFNGATLNVNKSSVRSSKLYKAQWVAIDGPLIGDFIFEGTHASNNLKVNGVDASPLTDGSNTSDPGTNIVTDKIYIGSRGGSSFFFDGKISEIIIYGKALSSSERNEILAYLSNKWGISATYDSGSLQTEFDTQYDFNLVLPISVDQAKLIKFSSYNNGILNVFEKFYWEDQPTITYTAPVNNYNRSKTINIEGCTDNTQRQNVLNTIGAIAKEERREFKITIPYFMEIFVMDTIVVSSPTIVPDDAFIWGVSKWGDGSKWRKSLQADNIPNNVAWLVRSVKHNNFKTELTLQEII